jgi:hypothetical protein
MLTGIAIDKTIDPNLNPSPTGSVLKRNGTYFGSQS